MNILLFLVAFYLSVNLFGNLIEKIKIPKIYAALFLGVILSTQSQFTTLAHQPLIELLSKFGMFALLFLLGFNLKLHQLQKNRRLILKTAFSVIGSELAVGTFILYKFFDIPLTLSFIISISFATVGEVALLPILEEFKILKTKLGQIILGVSVADDVIEILAFLLLLIYISSFQLNELFAELIPLIAIASGFLTSKITNSNKKIDKFAHVLALFVFGPIFFFYAGIESNLKILIDKFFVILAITLTIKLTKIISSYFVSHKELGLKKSIVMGISLCIKFSTSIIILLILLSKGLINEELFSILIGIKVLFKFIVPVLLSNLLSRWKLDMN